MDLLWDIEQVQWCLWDCVRWNRVAVLVRYPLEGDILYQGYTVKILKIGTPEIITIIALQLEQLDFTVQYCVQKMQTE